MNNIYYMIWSDAILSFKKHHPDRKDWKLALFTLVTWMHALNAWIIILWLKYFKILIIPKFNINVFSVTLLDNFFTFAIEFALPFGILNYFLVFYNNRYKKFTEKYNSIKTRYALIYSLSMTFGALISAILYGILT